MSLTTKPHSNFSQECSSTAALSQLPDRIGALLLVILLSATLLSVTGCNNTSSANTSSAQAQYQGTAVTLGNLSLIIYDQEMVHNTSGDDCLALYVHVTNRGTSAESVMGSYNVSRNQGEGTHLKVAVAYDTNGNALHTGEKRIDPGESEDITLCFVLINHKPVTITFGNEERGVAETTLTIPLPEESE